MYIYMYIYGAYGCLEEFSGEAKGYVGRMNVVLQYR